MATYLTERAQAVIETDAGTRISVCIDIQIDVDSRQIVSADFNDRFRCMTPEGARIPSWTEFRTSTYPTPTVQPEHFLVT